MIDMGIGHIAMQAGVDRGGARIEVEGAMVQVVNHLVFLIEASVQAFQRFKLVHVERGKTIELHRTDVASRSLDPQHGDRRFAERIHHHDLGRGIAATKIGNAQVSAQKIRPVEQKPRLIETLGLRFIPQRGNRH